MKRLFSNLYLGLLVLCWSSALQALDLDDQLRLVIQAYGLEPALCEVDARVVKHGNPELGRLLFKSPVLSGDYDTSCGSCHQDQVALADGLPLAVGVGGAGKGNERLASDGVVVPRNAFTLFGRASAGFNTFFWDGKVMEIQGKIYSPLGEGFAQGFRSPLAVAAVLPILARDEFLGRQGMLNGNSHLERINSAYYADKVAAANQVLQEIIRNPEDPVVRELRALLAARGQTPDDFDLTMVGNALASFIAQKTAECPQTRWERYIEGDPSALTKTEKQGAVIFFGKGRCAGCHSGNRFSDLQFHSIGVPQGDLGPHMHGQDLGRADVTYQTEDRYRFRTPPLWLVSKTAPYGHNGRFETLDDVVRFHLNPIPFFVAHKWTSQRESLTYGKVLASRSFRLGFIDITSEDELTALIAFLKTL
ncbi:methylamine utilization protein MauG [Marinobacter halodurans]|uniref:Methylamine utilization protein MauG n=1 Tax=Marinobacter halodurans TaxID=2528979 RepID=A0ABY1ZFC5_9GAMM|nr:methylamine utilization protein MauG [Marinobacter halodurans]